MQTALIGLIEGFIVTAVFVVGTLLGSIDCITGKNDEAEDGDGCRSSVGDLVDRTTTGASNANGLEVGALVSRVGTTTLAEVLLGLVVDGTPVECTER